MEVKYIKRIYELLIKKMNKFANYLLITLNNTVSKLIKYMKQFTSKKQKKQKKKNKVFKYTNTKI